EIGEIPKGFYPGEYLRPVGEALAKERGSELLQLPEESWLTIVREFAVAKMMDLIRADLEQIGIRHDVFTSEYELAQIGKIEEAFNLLDEKGLIYVGTLPKPKGKAPDDWEEREQT